MSKTLLNLVIATLPDARILFYLSLSNYQKTCIFDNFNDQTAIKAIIPYATIPYVYREQVLTFFFFHFFYRALLFSKLLLMRLISLQLSHSAGYLNKLS